MGVPENEIEQVRPWIFTFGSGQRLVAGDGGGTVIVTGASGLDMSETYVRIVGTAQSARQQMVDLFGVEWSGQYETEEGPGVAEFQLHELDISRWLPEEMRPPAREQTSDRAKIDAEWSGLPLPISAESALSLVDEPLPLFRPLSDTGER